MSDLRPCRTGPVTRVLRLLVQRVIPARADAECRAEYGTGNPRSGISSPNGYRPRKAPMRSVMRRPRSNTTTEDRLLILKPTKPPIQSRLTSCYSGRAPRGAPASLPLSGFAGRSAALVDAPPAMRRGPRALVDQHRKLPEGAVGADTSRSPRGTFRALMPSACHRPGGHNRLSRQQCPEVNEA